MEILLALDEKTANLIKGYFYNKSNYKIIGNKYDGNVALESIIGFQPDIVLMDLVLPKRDGFSILEILQGKNFINRPEIIIISALDNDFSRTLALEKGAFDFIAKPFSLTSLKRRIDNAFKNNIPISRGTEKEIDEQITAICLMLGMPTQIAGYQYLKYAIKLCYKDFNLINKVVSELYPKVAMHFDVSVNKVERSIRHILNIVCNNERTDKLNNIFGYKLYDTMEHLANSEFIALVVSKLQIDNAV